MTGALGPAWLSTSMLKSTLWLFDRFRKSFDILIAELAQRTSAAGPSWTSAGGLQAKF